MKYVICLLLAAAAIIYAAKTPEVFGPGVEGFLKTKSTTAAWTVVTNTPGTTDGIIWVVFTGLDAKSQIQLTKCEDASIIVNDAKQIKQKGKISGSAKTLMFGTPNDLNTLNFGGNPKAMIKLKGVNVGTVLAGSIKMVQCNDLTGGHVGSDSAKGVLLKAEGNVAGADAANRVMIGKVPSQPGATIPATKIKGISAKGAIEYADAVNTVAAKPTKTKLKAKLPPTGDVLVSAGQYSEKSKNVTLTVVE